MATHKELTSAPSKMKISIDEYTAPDKAASTAKSNRSKNFNPLEAGKWGQKSIALEWAAMYEEAMDLKMDHEVAIASGASDIDAMSDSPAYAILTPIPDESHDHMFTEFNHVRSVSELEHEHNKVFSDKLNTLHDKISVFISKIADKLQNTKNNKLKQSYQDACDFLADIQHEIALFDEDIVANEGKLKTMDQKTRRLQSKYEKAVAKLKNINAEQHGLKSQIHLLSMEKSQLLLSAQNLVQSAEDTEDDIDRRAMSQKQSVPVIQKTDRFKFHKVDSYENRLEEWEIDPQRHPYLYDDFEYDEFNACVSGLWHMFSKEIGFFLWNRNG